MLSHALALKSDAVGIVHDLVEDGVGDGAIGDEIVPLGHRQLR